jgi:hypothetical protein
MLWQEAVCEGVAGGEGSGVRCGRRQHVRLWREGKAAVYVVAGGSM